MSQTQINIDVIKSESLSDEFDERYIIVNKETGETLDDAQGYGYRSKQKAFAAWNYKNSNAYERRAKDKHIKRWLTEHHSFADDIEYVEFQIAKERGHNENVKFDVSIIEDMLNDSGIEHDFTAKELFDYWKRNK